MAAGVLSLPLSAFAIPAAEGLVKSAQPDGTPVEIRLHGDERFNWATSPDGFTLLRDADGFWTVAEADANGEGRPSAIITTVQRPAAWHRRRNPAFLSPLLRQP